MIAVVGLAGVLVNLIGLGVPLPWRDEGATWIANQRTLGALASMLGRIDAVHGLYYLGMRGWTHLFGSSILSLRLVSAIAVGAGAAAVALLAWQLRGRKVAIWAGLIYGVLPLVTAAGVEARSYALSTACGAAAMALLWRAVTTGRRSAWIGFIVVAALSVHLFLFLAFIYLAVPLALVWQPRPVRIRGLASCLTAGLACVPITVVSLGQTEQVSWLARHEVGVREIAQSAFWGRSWAAWLGSLLLAAALVNAARLFRRPENRSMLALLTGWLVLPTVVLLLLSLVKPSYTEAYVTGSAPALAILLALLVDWARHWRRLAVGAAILTVGAVGLWTNRQPEIHPTALEAVTTLAARGQPGDGIYVVYADRHVLWWAFPEQLEGFVNLSSQDSARWKRRELKEPSQHVEDITGRLAGVSRVWVFADRGQVGDSVSDLVREGFSVVDTTKTATGYPVTLVLLERR